MRFILTACLYLLSVPAFAAELRVAVAANFHATAKALATQFEQHSGHTIALSTASTGVLYSQIRGGAPFDILLAADSESTAALEADGLTVKWSRQCYAVGRLVLLGAKMHSALADASQRLAIANPATAPYGRAALEVLKRDAFASRTEKTIVRATNVAQAYQFWHSGAVELALVARALAPDSGVAIPADWHQPLRQEAVLLKRAEGNGAAREFLAFLASAPAAALIADAGYGDCP